MAFKFIHMADVHLDTPFLSRDDNLRKALKDSLRQSLNNCINLAVNEKVDAILIAGDLLEGSAISYQSEKLLQEMAERLRSAGIMILYSPGNHDPYGSLTDKSSQYYSNIFVFGSDKPTTVPVPGRNGKAVAYVTGMGHGSLRDGRNLAGYFPPARHDIPHVALLHTFIAGSASAKYHDRYAPCTLEDLLNKGYSYWALGHIHAREEISKEPYIIYPGNLMGRNPGETGQKGAYLVEIDGSNNIKLEFKPLSPVCWETITISSLTGVDSLFKLENLICSEISSKLNEVGYFPSQSDMQLSKNNSRLKMLYRIVLEGPCPIYSELLNEEDVLELEESIKSALCAEYVEIISDNITRPADPENYKGEPHVLSTVLALIEDAKYHDELLLKLAPDILAGLEPSAGKKEAVEYLRSLLDNLDYEAVSYLLREV